MVAMSSRKDDLPIEIDTLAPPEDGPIIPTWRLIIVITR